jgi:MOSC domain-containing protein YiiM
MSPIKHLTMEELEAGLETIRQAPTDFGSLQLIVRRPQVDLRETLEVAELDLQTGLVGDNWQARGSSRTLDQSAHPGMQITLMNSRAIALIAVEQDRWPLAGDQLYVDLDLSAENLPAGTRLALGEAVLEVSEIPHTGCAKFVARFGLEAQKFVNSPAGKELHLRGINARVVQAGVIQVGNLIRKIE